MLLRDSIGVIQPFFVEHQIRLDGRVVRGIRMCVFYFCMYFAVRGCDEWRLIRWFAVHSTGLLEVTDSELLRNPVLLVHPIETRECGAETTCSLQLNRVKIDQAES